MASILPPLTQYSISVNKIYRKKVEKLYLNNFRYLDLITSFVLKKAICKILASNPLRNLCWIMMVVVETNISHNYRQILRFISSIYIKLYSVCVCVCVCLCLSVLAKNLQSELNTGIRRASARRNASINIFQQFCAIWGSIFSTR